MELVTLLMYIMVFLFGIVIGSFLNVCIYRIPKGESIVTVPSHCMSCGKRLRWYELIPLFSYLFLRGRCSACKSRISPQYPLVEAGNGILWILSFSRFGLSAEFLLSCLLLSALLVVSVTDGRTREIPPGVSLFILILGAVRLLLHLDSWGLYVIGLFSVSLPLYILLVATGGRGIGGGDIKLMGGVGLFLGWKLCLLSFALACVLGAVFHLFLMAIRKADRTLALGPYLSAGAFIALLWGSDLLSWYTGLFL